MKFLILTVFMVFSMLSSGWAQGKPKSIAELAKYKGPDREKIILRGAKAEGKVVWYTSLGGKSFKAIRKAFAKKYPEIKIEVYRAGSKSLSQRILPEAQSKRYIADAIESTPPILMLMRDKGITMPYTSPLHKKFPEEHTYRAAGGGVWWVTDRASFIGLGYNTNLIPKGRVPKNWEDLLKPEFTGKVAMTLSSTGDRVVGMMLKYKGMEYLNKLKKQKIKLFKLSGSATRDLIIKGEIPLAPVIFRNHALVKIHKGAPLGWVPMDVVPTNAGGSGLFAHAPHPHAALLLIDFIIGKEGQDILQSFYYGVAWKNYPFKRVLPEKGMTTKQYNKSLKKWDKILRSLGRKQ
ncbi:MAG: ABC transporter substrate-binding protein [Candidatus Binatia bacterium]